MAGSARIACVWVLLLWLAAEVRGQKTPVGAPAPSVDCSSALIDLADCLSYVQNGQNVTKPEGQCCSNLKKVVKKEVSCLCDVFKQAATYGINITKALTLPSACGVSTPSVSKCNINIPGLPGVPAAAPAPSPSAGAPSSGVTGAPSQTPGKSAAAAYPVPSFGFFTSMAVTLWLCYQSHGLEF